MEMIAVGSECSTGEEVETKVGEGKRRGAAKFTFTFSVALRAGKVTSTRRRRRRRREEFTSEGKKKKEKKEARG